jgi:RimJ/RimL family protein N-acetyltransferase
VGHSWPFFDLVVKTPTLQLRIPDDELLEQLAVVIARGIHDPAWMPFDDPPWTDEPSPGREMAWMTRQWAARSAIHPDGWRLRFAVLDSGGVPVGMQDLLATTFLALRTVGTYSWLGRQHQGQGLGKEMRAAVLHFAFDTLGAERAESAAFEDNVASARVSESLGYERNGYEWALRRGRPDRLTRFILRRDTWLRHRRSDISVTGASHCKPLLLGEG